MEWHPSPRRVWAVYFSATGTTKKMVSIIADVLVSEISSEHFPIIRKNFDFTTPSARDEFLEFSKDDILIFGAPVYAGRLPNLIIDYIKSIKGNGALAVPVVLFGNRAFDDALIELRDILEAGGFRSIAAGAFVGEHSFSSKIANGRPNSADLKFAEDFGFKVVDKIRDFIRGGVVDVVEVPGVPSPYRGYYRPKDILGGYIDIRKVKPETNFNCDNCGICIGLCPMGAIDSSDPRVVGGICIKCCACIRYCPKNAKIFIDSGYLYHLDELEKSLSSVNSENEVFL